VGLTIESMTAVHGPAVLAVYQAGLDTRDASFETAAPAWDRWDGAHLPDHRFVGLDADEVIGWAACSPVSPRPVYRGVVEESVYVAPRARGRGVGRALLDALIASTEDDGIWTLETAIFPENVGSIALHEAVGFRVVGRRERIGRHHRRWRDTLLLERRSNRV